MSVKSHSSSRRLLSAVRRPLGVATLSILMLVPVPGYVASAQQTGDAATTQPAPVLPVGPAPEVAGAVAHPGPAVSGAPAGAGAAHAPALVPGPAAGAITGALTPTEAARTPAQAAGAPSLVVAGAQARPAAAAGAPTAALSAPQPVIPAGLPRTGDGSTASGLPSWALAVLAVFAATLGVRRLASARGRSMRAWLDLIG